MGKVLAIVGLFFLLKWAAPHIAAGNFIAPAPLPPTWWGFEDPQLAAVAGPRPTTDYSYQKFDFWNN